MTPDTFPCALCGGQVVPHQGPGRTALYCGAAPEFNIPDGMVIPRCQTCGEDFVTPENVGPLDACLAQQFEAWKTTQTR